MSWIALVIAGMFEVVWALALKESEGFSKPGPTVVFGLAYVGSAALLGVALKHLPVGTGYAVWVGIGAVGTAVLGMVLLGDRTEPGRIAAIALIAIGVVWLALLERSVD
jgi:quaternary ammonium compound-resistance protein SugE